MKHLKLAASCGKIRYTRASTVPAASNTMYLDQFHTADQHNITISAGQASRFAKEIAGDFNPIHDPDAKRFCVPGDLLFSLVLANYGVSPKMCFIFKGMVGDNATLDFSPTDAAEFDIGNGDKVFMSVRREGEPRQDNELVETLSRQYVAFSGRNFPHTIQPLLEKNGVMLNPERPLVIYERMQFELDRLEFTDIELAFASADMEVNGKRGEVSLHFDMTSGGQVIGHGFKRLLVSGLIPYDASIANKLVDDYLALKSNYRKA